MKMERYTIRNENGLIVAEYASRDDVLQKLHDSEINAKIEWFYDDLWIVTLGDDMNGWGEAICADSLESALSKLIEAAILRYPNSEFARRNHK